MLANKQPTPEGPVLIHFELLRDCRSGGRESEVSESDLICGARMGTAIEFIILPAMQRLSVFNFPVYLDWKYRCLLPNK